MTPFELPADDDVAGIARAVAGVAVEMRGVEQHLRRFRTRRQVRDHLLANREPTDRRDFVIPSKLPLKLFTAAALAVIDQDPSAKGLVAEATDALSRYKDKLTSGRLDRLSSALAGRQ
jgi:hypothetical protein